MAEELDLLRTRIDELDKKILELITERVAIVLRVGDYKREHGLAVYDPARERSLLARLEAYAQAPLDEGTVSRIFERIIDESRRLEQRHFLAPLHPSSPPAAEGRK